MCNNIFCVFNNTAELLVLIKLAATSTIPAPISKMTIDSTNQVLPMHHQVSRPFAQLPWQQNASSECGRQNLLFLYVLCSVYALKVVHRHIILYAQCIHTYYIGLKITFTILTPKHANVSEACTSFTQYCKHNPHVARINCFNFEYRSILKQ